MAEYRLTAAAERYLSEIYRYSFENFGEAQADRYLLNLHECISLLADHPRIGMSINHVKEGYFRHVCQSHLILYRLNKDETIIARILHKSRDLPRHI